MPKSSVEMKKDKIEQLVCSGMRTDVHGNDVFVRDSAWCNLSLDRIRTRYTLLKHPSLLSRWEKHVARQLILFITVRDI